MAVLRIPPHHPVSVFLALAGVCLGIPASAQWAPNGNPIVRRPFHQTCRAAIADGAGGAFVVWNHADDAVLVGRRITRVTSLGDTGPGWPEGGVAIPAVDVDRFVADGSGGLWIARIEMTASESTGTIQVRRLGHDGFWLAPERAYDADHATWYVAIARRTGAPFLAWTHDPGGSNKELRVLRLTEDGAPAPGWPADGLALGGARREYLVSLAVDDADGANLLTIEPAGDRVNLHLYRALAGALAPGWPDTGVLVASGAGQSPEYPLVPSGSGAIVVWWRSTGAESRVYAQRFTAAGAVATGWPAAGLELSGAGPNFNPLAIDDGAAGAYAVWYRPVSLFATRVLADGTVAPGWPVGGREFEDGHSEQAAYAQALTGDGNGGMQVVWAFWPIVWPTNEGADLYAQRFGPDGARPPGWPEEGLPVAVVPGDQVEARIAADGPGDAIVAWTDARDSETSGYDVFATRLTAGGVGQPPITAPIRLRIDSANPGGEPFAIAFDLARGAAVRVAVLDLLGRKVRTLADGTYPAGANRVTWDGTGEDRRRVPAGVYLVQARGAGAEEVRRLVVLR